MLGAARIPFRLAIWIGSTCWVGTRAVYRLIRIALRWHLAVSETLPCPRGHRTPAYGVFTCSCSALVEGWVFARCSVCGQGAGWTECSECGLPVRNPTL
jgi:hypothetical protein